MFVGIFQAIQGLYGQILNGAAQQTINQVLAAVVGPFRAAAMLYVIFYGFQVLYGKFDAYDLFVKTVWLGVTGYLLQPGNFQTWVSTPILTTIPQQINNITGAVGTVQATANGFDLLLQRLAHEGYSITASLPFLDVSDRIAVAGYQTIATYSLVFGYIIYQIQQAFLNLVVCVVPVALLLGVFKALRPILERNIGKIAGLLISMLLIIIMLNFTLNFDAQFMDYSLNANADGGVLGDIAAAPARIWAFGITAAFFFVSAVMLVVVPTIGSFIGGGLALSVAPVIAQGARMLITKGRGGL